MKDTDVSTPIAKSFPMFICFSAYNSKVWCCKTKVQVNFWKFSWFQDTVDILVGWHIDTSQTKELTSKTAGMVDIDTLVKTFWDSFACV